jgi:hypothetical protein
MVCIFVMNTGWKKEIMSLRLSNAVKRGVHASNVAVSAPTVDNYTARAGVSPDMRKNVPEAQK